jgi:RHS repeat-associated protein
VYGDGGFRSDPTASVLSPSTRGGQGPDDTVGEPVLNYEEYHPYGTTSWWASNGSTDVSQKRYRYTGMERDDETGLQRHGVRGYVPWLGRWDRPDPIGLKGGPNRFAYVRNRPTTLHDQTGHVDPEFGWKAIHRDMAEMPEGTLHERFVKGSLLPFAETGIAIDDMAGRLGLALTNLVDTLQTIVGATAPGQAFAAHSAAGGGWAGARAGAEALVGYGPNNIGMPLLKGSLKSAYNVAVLPQRNQELAYRIMAGEATPWEQIREDLGGAVGITDGEVATLEEQVDALGASVVDLGTYALGARMGGVGRPQPPNTRVSSWAQVGVTPDLKTGRWAMVGEASPLNFVLTGLPGPTWHGGFDFR